MKKTGKKPGRPRKDQMRQIRICPWERNYMFRIVQKNGKTKVVEFKAGDRVSQTQINELNIAEHHLEPKGSELSVEKTSEVMKNEKIQNQIALSTRGRTPQQIGGTDISQETVMVSDGKGNEVEKKITVGKGMLDQRKPKMPSYISLTNAAPN